MKKMLCMAAAVLFLLSLNVGVSLAQTDEVTKPKAGISWREKVVKERQAKYRASERRNALKRNAQMGKQEPMQGVSVEAYNAQIRSAGQ